jgi:hypothetical protein
MKCFKCPCFNFKDKINEIERIKFTHTGVSKYDFITNVTQGDVFQIDTDINSTPYYILYKNFSYELDMTRLQVWIYNKDYICVHGATDQHLNRHSLEKYLGKSVNEVIQGDTFNSDNEWRELILNNSQIIESKRTTYINKNLVYVESKPLFYSSERNSLYAILFIIIPYADSQKKVSYEDKQYTEINAQGKHPQVYVPEPDQGWIKKAVLVTRGNRPVRVRADSSITKFKRLLKVDYELDITKIQVWVFSKDMTCIYATQDTQNLQYDIEYYLGRNIHEIFTKDDGLRTKIIRLVEESLQLTEIRTTLEFDSSLLYVEVKPLFYNTDIKKIYGCLAITIPYKEIIKDVGEHKNGGTN